MDFRDNALVFTAGLALIFATLFAGAAGLLIYRNQQQQAQQNRQLARIEAERAAAQAPRSRRSLDEAHGRTFAERARAAARIEELKRALEQKNRLLESKTRQLNQAMADYEALRNEMNESMVHMVELLGTGTPAVGTPQPDDESPPAPNAPTEAEIKAARQELLDWQQDQELEQARILLVDTTDELTRLQAEADREILLLTDEIVQFRSLTADTLVQIGPPAIPVLNRYLQDERVTVRRWAAEMLAEFGPAAEEALPNLEALTNDADPQVRQAAAQALAAIRP